MSRQRWRADGKFAQQQATIGNFTRQFQVGSRIDPIQPGAYQRNRAARAAQRALVSGAVDAGRQAGHHGQAGLAERGGESVCVVEAFGRRMAAADDRQGRALQQGKVALGVEQQGRIGQVQPDRRVVRVGQRQDPPTGFGGEPRRGALDQRRQRFGWLRQFDGHRLVDHTCPSRDRGRQHRLRAAECGQQSTCTLSADARRLQQLEPGGDFVAIHVQGLRSLRAGESRLRDAVA